MKMSKYLAILALLAISFSCSKDDDPAPIEQAALSFGASGQVVTIPQGLANSQDENAQQAYSYLALANSMSAFTSFFNVPSGAVKSSTPIVGSNVNGRVGATLDSYVVYTYVVEEYGTVAYQIGDGGDYYSFEIFVKELGQAEFVRLLYAEEQKDKSSGFMDIYDISSTTDPVIIFGYTWARDGDELAINFFDGEQTYLIELVINTKTGAGSATYYEGENKVYEIVWDAQGSGSWKLYSGGVVVDQGTW